MNEKKKRLYSTAMYSHRICCSLICLVNAFIFSRFISHSFQVSFRNKLQITFSQYYQLTLMANKLPDTQQIFFSMNISESVVQHVITIIISMLNDMRYPLLGDVFPFRFLISFLWRKGVQSNSFNSFTKSFSRIKYSFIGWLVSNYVILMARNLEGDTIDRENENVQKTI